MAPTHQLLYIFKLDSVEKHGDVNVHGSHTVSISKIIGRPWRTKVLIWYRFRSTNNKNYIRRKKCTTWVNKQKTYSDLQTDWLWRTNKLINKTLNALIVINPVWCHRRRKVKQSYTGKSCWKNHRHYGNYLSSKLPFIAINNPSHHPTFLTWLSPYMITNILCHTPSKS